jgi:hypothetical protein
MNLKLQISCLTCKFFLLLLPAGSLAQPVFAQEIYVSPLGNDLNEGTKSAPLATVSGAKKRAYDAVKTDKYSDVTICLQEGIYQITEPVVLDPSNEADYSIHFKALPGTRPVISGGIQLSGWTKNSNGFWEAKVPNFKDLKPRGLFINGQRAKRARFPNEGYCGVQACHFDPRPETGGWAVVPAAVSAEWAEDCSFQDCTIENVGGSGIWLGPGCKNNRIRNSVFNDISGNGMMIGEGRDREIDGEKWWQAAPGQVTLENTVESCAVKNCGVQFYGAVGIWCGLTAGTVIQNNEIMEITAKN